MSDNQKKLNEQLAKIVMDDSLTDEVRLKKVKYLVRLGANVNQKVNGKSLLKIAREKGYKEIEEVIKESLRKSFEEALDSGNCEIVVKEIKDVKRGKPIVSEEEVLSLGKQFWDEVGNLKSAKEIEDLIQQGAYINIQNKDGDTALMHASAKGSLEVVEMLLQNGADVHHKDNHDQTALMMAAGNGHKEIAEMLLEGGADVNGKSETGDTALIIASYCGHKEVVEMLLQNGADVNIQNKDGMTALMWASKKGHLDVVHILLEGGANVRKRDYWHQTALQMASGPFKNAIIKEIEESFQKTTPTIGEFLGEIFGGLTR